MSYHGSTADATARRYADAAISATSGGTPAQLAVLTDLLVCADTVVHLRRASTWSVATYRALIVDTLIALSN
jgi:hypothetical protein